MIRLYKKGKTYCYFYKVLNVYIKFKNIYIYPNIKA